MWTLSGNLIDMATFQKLPNQKVQIANGTDNTVIFANCTTDSNGYFRGVFQAPAQTLIVEYVFAGDSNYEASNSGQIQLATTVVYFGI